MESRLLFLFIIMMIKIIPAVFIRYHCSSINSCNFSTIVTVERHLCVGNNLLFLHFLSLITLERYDVRAGFRAVIFVLEKIGHLLHYF